MGAIRYLLGLFMDLWISLFAFDGWSRLILVTKTHTFILGTPGWPPAYPQQIARIFFSLNLREFCFLSIRGESTSYSWEYAINNIWGRSALWLSLLQSRSGLGNTQQAHVQLDLRHYGLRVKLCWMWKLRVTGNSCWLGSALCPSDPIVIWSFSPFPAPPVLPSMPPG